MDSGTAFGELSIIDRGKRSASVIADTKLECAKLNFNDLEKDPSEKAKDVMLKLTRNIARILSDRLRRTNDVLKSVS